VAGNNRKRAYHAALGHRHARIRRDGYCARHPRHHFERHARRDARQRFLPASPEYEWVAPFEPHHQLALLRSVDQQRVDLLLRQPVLLRQFADIDPLAVGARLVQHAGWDQPVECDHIRLPDPI